MEKCPKCETKMFELPYMARFVENLGHAEKWECSKCHEIIIIKKDIDTLKEAKKIAEEQEEFVKQQEDIQRELANLDKKEYYESQ